LSKNQRGPSARLGDGGSLPAGVTRSAKGMALAPFFS
jgi:hypothetical protein